MSKHEPFNGVEILDASPQRVHDFLINLEVLVKIVPGLVKSERVDESTVKTVIRPGFSFIRTNLKQDFTLVEHVPHEKVVIDVHAKGIGTAFSVKSTMDLSSHEDGNSTKLEWEAEIMQMTGLVAALGTTIIRAAADQVIKQGFEAMRTTIEAQNQTND
jgi:carbon monoxide dehydrogenase subunit G